jgi:hypothetical protein
MTETPQFDEIVTRYIQLRDHKAALKKQYEETVGPVTEAMEKIENALLKHLQATGTESMRTSAGTFYKTTSTKATVADRDGFMSFVKDNDLWALLEVRAAKTAVEQYRTEHNDLPPGINWTETYVVNVRRS